MTKSELTMAIAAKAKGAKPMVRRHFIQGLKYQKKGELKRILAKMRVTKEGDISLY
jgi:hypothetical protein